MASFCQCHPRHLQWPPSAMGPSISPPQVLSASGSHLEAWDMGMGSSRLTSPTATQDLVPKVSAVGHNAVPNYLPPHPTCPHVLWATPGALKVSQEMDYDPVWKATAPEKQE